MSFKKNLLFNYVSQIYVTLVSIVMVPFYVKYMGIEAYGLVGFFAMLQAWFQLLDVGLTPTMARETARFQGGSVNALSLRRLLRALEGVFVGVAVIGSLVLAGAASIIAARWLKVEHLSLEEVEQTIRIIALIVALRWVCGLYRGAVNGFERMVWLSGFNAAVATARFVLVVPIFIYIGATPTHFFIFQLMIAVVELGVLILKTYALLPRIDGGTNAVTPWDWMPLRSVLKFSLSVAFTGSVWVFVTQTDKLVLSKLLSLTDYSYFTLAVLVSSGVMVVSGPISSALMPRMARLVAEHDARGLIQIYRSSTRLVAAIAVPAALMLAFFSKEVLIAWTGDQVLAHKVAPILSLYALGNGILALGAFPYYLQFAKGDLKLHVMGSLLFLLLLVPALVWSAAQFGAVGAGYAWLLANAVYFVVWVPLVHAKFLRGLHLRWVAIDVGLISLVGGGGGVLIDWLVTWPIDRTMLSVYLVMVGFLLCSATFLCFIGLRWIFSIETKRSIAGGSA